MLNDVSALVKLGGVYAHYKQGHEYTIVDFIVDEASDSIHVVYEAQYEPFIGIKFSRSLDSFIEEVEKDGVKMKRFELVN